MKLKLFLFLCICVISWKGKAQTIEKEGDSVSIYHDINDLSKKSKFSRFVYKLVFKESALKAENLVPFKPKKKKKIVSAHQEGRVIRNISIETLDPFGYSLTNEKKAPKRKFESG